MLKSFPINNIKKQFSKVSSLDLKWDNEEAKEVY